MKIENDYEITVGHEEKFSDGIEVIIISRPTMAEALQVAEGYAMRNYGNYYVIIKAELMEEVK